MPTGTSTFNGIDGTLITFSVDVNETSEKGDYSFLLRDNKLTVRDGEGQLSTLDLENTRTTLTFIDVMLGDVNSDGEVDLSDAIMVTYYSLHEVPSNFNEAAADMNGDGEIDLSDAIIIIYKSLGVK